MHIKLSSNISKAEVDGELVLLDLNSGVFYGLNQTASIIIELIENGENIEEAINYLSDLWSIETDILRNDIYRLIENMKSKGLLL